MQLSDFPAWFAVYLAFLAVLCGSAYASAAECAVGRLTRHEPWAVWHSRCSACGHTLRFGDLIPIASWLFLRGRCRYCGAKIGLRPFLCETLTGGAFLALLIRYGFTAPLLRGAVLCCVLLPAALFDLETFEIPDALPAAGAVFWAATLPFAAGGWVHGLWWGLLGASLAAGVWLVALAVEKRLGQAAMGGADLKLYALAGLYLGPALNLFNVALSCLLGLAFAGAARRAGSRARSADGNEDIPGSAFPFGPAIALGTVLSYLAGDAAVAWYLRLFIG